ncbi:MAG: right-handed parallel beta-helix repeat-containing protein [Saprospiraceae bacterium]|nr:right-handed parallel beta-helix repeat-containing protein [Saprospiraceae bacterium]
MVLLSKANDIADFKNSTFTGMAHGVYLDKLPNKTAFSDCTFAYQTGNGITSFGSGIDVSSNNTFTDPTMG